MAAVALFASGTAAMAAAIFGLFRVVAPLTLFAFVVVMAMLAWLAARRRLVMIGDRHDLMAAAVALVAAVSIAMFHHLDFTTTFDTGMYLADAVIIAQTGGRQLDLAHAARLFGFEGIVGQGASVAAESSYSALAAYFVYLGGWEAAWLVNAPLAAISIMSLYHIGRRLGARLGAVFAVAFYQASLVTLWLQRWLMTENAAAAVFWISVLLAMSLWERWDAPRALALVVVWSFGILVRPESFLVAAWFAAVLLFAHRKALAAAVRRFSATPGTLHGRARLWVTLVSSILLTVAPLILLVRLRGDVLDFAFSRLGILLQGRPLPDAPDVPTTGVGPNWGDYAVRYEWDSLNQYLIPLFLAIGLAGIAAGIVRRRPAAHLLVLAAGYSFWLVMPPVTVYHPWFMRKMWMFLLPLAWLLAGAVLDPSRVGWRWPMKRSRRGQLRARPDLAIVAAVAAVLLLLFNVAVAAPLAFVREEDGNGAFAIALAERLPDDAVVAFETVARGPAGSLAVLTHTEAIAWFPHAPTAMLATIQADEAGHPVYLVVPGKARSPTPDLRSPAPLEEEPMNFTLDFQWIPRDTAGFDGRSYIQSPPLEQGYSPFVAYLDQLVPPDELQTFTINLTVVRPESPLVLERKIRFDPDEWSYTSDGMVAQTDNASMTVDPAYDAFERTSRPVRFHAVYFAADREPIPVVARLADNSTIDLGNLPSDGSGALILGSVDLPPGPRNITSIDVPAGTTFRGVQLAERLLGVEY